MDVPDPDQTPFAAVTAQTNKIAQVSSLFRVVMFVLPFAVREPQCAVEETILPSRNVY